MTVGSFALSDTPANTVMGTYEKSFMSSTGDEVARINDQNCKCWFGKCFQSNGANCEMRTCGDGVIYIISTKFIWQGYELVIGSTVTPLDLLAAVASNRLLTINK